MVEVVIADVETMKVTADVEIMIMKIADVDEIMMIIGEGMIDVEIMMTDVEIMMIIAAETMMIVAIEIMMTEDGIETGMKDVANQCTSVQYRAKKCATLLLADGWCCLIAYFFFYFLF